MTMTRLLRLGAVQALTGVKRSTIYARAAEGTFPKPTKIGPRASAWVEAEIADWISRCIRDSRVGDEQS